MPVITFAPATLERLLGRPVARKELVETIPLLGASVERADDKEWAVEFFPDRPDLFSVEGTARALRAFLGIRPGVPEYKLTDSDVTMTVEKSVLPVRPHVVCAVVRGVSMGDAEIAGLMSIQEDLHWGLGARRRKVSVGVHDLGGVTPPFVYKAVPPDGFSFVPLQSTERMTMRDIVEKHPKGVAYKHLVEPFREWPLILDAKGDVLSFPPIINGTATTVTPRTKDLFIDVTGTDAFACSRVLNILCCNLADAGAKVQRVKVVRPEGASWTPDLAPERREVPVAYASRLLGVDLKPDAAVKALERMGLGARASGGKLLVQVPPYRADVLHDVDIVEDIGKGLGYATLGPERPRSVTFGAQDPVERPSGRAREVLLGLGFTEVMTLTLSNERDQFERLGLPEGPSAKVTNPITEDHTILRVSLLPSLLGILRKNVHRDLPQRVFEVGDVVVPAADTADTADTAGSFVNERRLAFAAIHAKASFTECKSLAEALARDLGLDAKIAAAEHAAFVPGRVAALVAAGARLGVFGELHPRAIAAFGLANPVIALEIAVVHPRGFVAQGWRVAK